MEIKPLENTPLYLIVNCLLEAFKGYFVPMPSDLLYWEKRFLAARVIMEYSYGMFDNGQLVGFIINGIDNFHSEPTAFNTGTGVLPNYRGCGIVDKLYEYAIPRLQEKGVTHCRLEVIVENERAINVYQRIGFKITRRLHCFKGSFGVPGSKNPLVKKIEHRTILKGNYADEIFYSWDHTKEAVLAVRGDYESFLVFNELQQEMGYFTVNPSTGYIARLERAEVGTYNDLLSAIRQVIGEVKMNNVDESRIGLRSALTNAGLENVIDQYEMVMKT
ncbi:GNAT family N-acetyltransferase [Antarcticibacterium flavum]|uniref:GNAT family N-acetyltransferase n=1 Tax=Antarcticibacterium flavum TaxID=2058175 RepID=A0A5B7X6W5_9FLAO|nr:MULTISPECIES: GNAT family N-acetyltransferase [Antarcticibacterium]MCM4160041.1 N-acetyltransferase [Antarcticibacterium sp. W02-3]QCY70373.1 GNAT family N-acetyltransferase [Antarcticibacterium flavum]